MVVAQGMFLCDLSISDIGSASSWKSFEQKTLVSAMLVITSTNPNVFVPSKWNTGSQIARIFTKSSGKIIFQGYLSNFFSTFNMP